MMPPDGDHAAAQFTWEILVRCGDPSVAAVGATFSPDTTKNGWFGMPDNVAFDSAGPALGRDRRQRAGQDRPRRRHLGRRDRRRAARHVEAFLSRAGRAPKCAGRASRPTTRRCSSPFSIRARPTRAIRTRRRRRFENPATRWPDFKPAMPPRPVDRGDHTRGGGKIGS